MFKLKTMLAGLCYFFLACTFVQPLLFAQQPQTILLLDDFENFPDNSLGEVSTVFADTFGSEISRLVRKDYYAYCQSGKSLQVNYKLTAASDGFCGLVSFLPLLDLSNYHYLSFRVKGLNGLDMIQVEMERQNGEKCKVSIWDFISCGPDTDWRKVVIPLDNFWNLSARTEMEKLVISFDQNASTINGSPLIGELYFDDFLFGSFFPGYIKIDPFDDKLSANATCANNGTFSPTGSTTNYTADLVCPPFPLADCDCHLRLNFNNGLLDDFGGYFAILGGGIDGWMGTGKNIAAYDTFYLEARALSSATNPGNFKVELKGNQVNTYRVSGISLTDQAYAIPFSAFNSQPFNPTEINEFTVVFEKNSQEVLAGSVLIDNIQLRAKGALVPDNTKPAAPMNVLVNGAPVMPINNLLPNTTATISATIENTNPRLESVRLEYKVDCAWVCAFRTFSPIPTAQVVFSINTNELPQQTMLEMRLVAESYNGCEAATAPFTAKVGQGLFNITPAELLRNAFEVFQHLRYSNGVYTDASRFEGAQFHPSSVAATGMGLIALCIADSMGWIDNAEALVMETLLSMNGLRPGFNPARNSCGWFRHFIWQDTGNQAWNSEYSSIDSGILTAGALFCKKYFSDNDSIARQADCLYWSIDWESMIADPQTGGIYLTADDNCIGGGQTLPFNEYMIVAWMAKNDPRQTGIAETLWNRHYESPDSLNTSDFMGTEVLTDNPGHFLPGFVHQFAYYLCHHYTNHSQYLNYFKNAMNIDTLWWSKNKACYDFIWGFGAGAANFWNVNGYQADNILVHPGTICSPHIIGGFIPVYPDAMNDLLRLHNTPRGVYTLQDAAETPVLWRFSTEDPTWRAGDVQVVDFSTLLFGGISHPDFLGTAFFEHHNNFDFPTGCPTDGSTEANLLLAEVGQNYPNPLRDFTVIPFSLKQGASIQLVIFRTDGKTVFNYDFGKIATGDYQFKWDRTDDSGSRLPAGFYYYSILDERSGLVTGKMIVLD